MKKRLTGVLLAAVTACSALTSSAFADDVYEREWNGNIYAYKYEDSRGKSFAFSHPVYDENTGGFSCQWEDAFDVEAEVGWGVPAYFSDKTYKALREMQISYDADFCVNGNGFFGIHGWMKDPLVEYYIIEGWGSWRPPGGVGGKGTLNVNGLTYDVYCSMRNNLPSIEGIQTFPQYWSVRTSSASDRSGESRVRGVIDLFRMFEAWEQKGMDLSGHPESVGLYAGGYGGMAGASSASFHVRSAQCYPFVYKLTEQYIPVVTTAPVQTEPAVTTTTEPKIPADENGIFCYDGFEDGIGAWQKRDYDTDTSALAADTEYHAEGKHSLRVTERSDSWNGAALPLSSYAIEPGKAYSFQAAVMQNSDSDTKVRMGLEYVDSGGTVNYDRIGSANCRKGEWNVIRTDAFTIPADSMDLKLFFDTGETAGTYWLDCVTVAEEGKAAPLDLSGAVPAATAAPKTGDANCDGVVDVADSVLVMRYAVADREAVITEQGIQNADVDKNGNTDSEDGVNILKYIAKKITLPVTKQETQYQPAVNP